MGFYGSGTMKKIIAREWLYFLGCVLFGITVFPAASLLLTGNKIRRMGRFYELLIGFNDTVPWLFALSPYLLFQLVRSIIWAMKTAKQE